jgi:hypothetical protein
VDDRKCRSTCDVQLVGCISDNTNPCVLLNQDINSFNIVRRSLNGQTVQAVVISDICSATLEPFHTLVHIPLRLTVFSVLY